MAKYQALDECFDSAETLGITEGDVIIAVFRHNLNEDEEFKAMIAEKQKLLQQRVEGGIAEIQAKA